MRTGPRCHIVGGAAIMAYAKLRSVAANYSARCKCFPTEAPKQALYGCDSKHQIPSQAHAGQHRPIVRAPPQELPISRATNQNIVTSFCQANSRNSTAVACLNAWRWYAHPSAACGLSPGVAPSGCLGTRVVSAPPDDMLVMRKAGRCPQQSYSHLEASLAGPQLPDMTDTPLDCGGPCSPALQQCNNAVPGVSV